jgi:hypothetical protein
MVDVHSNDFHVAVAIPTYRRPKQVVELVRTLRDIPRGRIVLSVVISDDDPSLTLEASVRRELETSGIEFRYLPQNPRLGQGTNLVAAVRACPSADYIWTMGDDDLPIVPAAKRLLDALRRTRPTVAVCEFRQGEDLEVGTFYEGEPRVITDLSEAVPMVIRFGKLSNTIFRPPSATLLDLVAEKFKGCMYDDKAIALLRLFVETQPSVLVVPELTVTGTESFSTLPYSMRVFCNLPRTTELAWRESGLPEDQLAQVVTHMNERGWWRIGLRSHFSRKTPLRYSNRVLARELTWPLRRRLLARRGTGFWIEP